MLEKCIESLRNATGKPAKFEGLKNKYKDRFQLLLLIDVGVIDKIRIGFDNHKNHPRPHIHTQVKKSRNTIYVDNGEFAHPSKFDSKTQNKLKEWVLKRKDCLKYIYDNIQNCRNKNDFEPIVDAINRHIE